MTKRRSWQFGVYPVRN